VKERWLKAELHSHCNLDPEDYKIIEYSPEALIEEAARLGYEVLAITCHNVDVWDRHLDEYARDLGITLIPGMEVTVERRYHTLAYNFQTCAEQINTFAKLRRLKRQETAVIAPHPYYPAISCLGGRLAKNHDVYDAVEWSGFYVPGLDFNGPARGAATRFGKPLVGNGDVHFLWQLGRTYSWIYAEPGVLSVLSALKRGRVRLETRPLRNREAARWWAATLWRSVFPVNRAPVPGIGPVLPDHF
jgi:predicted metal-dependent phosphoesterase TrpH